jgi:ferredoxin--NADP+ reductase/benzoate/toluate 1,2-dioxygenase reductase subunit
VVRPADKKTEHAVHSVRHLTDSTFVVRVERNDLKFKAGQFCNVKFAGDDTSREFSMYSGELDTYLEFLVKEVKNGDFSPRLKRCKPGDLILLDEPYDENFTVKDPMNTKQKNLFIASGTGIAPFHSYVRSHLNLNYQVLHGVSYLKEQYDMNDYAPGRYIGCVSREAGAAFHGRVTEYLKRNPVSGDTDCYLCGNANMTFEVNDLLRSQGVKNEMIHTEIFF